MPLTSATAQVFSLRLCHERDALRVETCEDGGRNSASECTVCRTSSVPLTSIVPQHFSLRARVRAYLSPVHVSPLRSGLLLPSVSQTDLQPAMQQHMQGSKGSSTGSGGCRLCSESVSDCQTRRMPCEGGLESPP